MKKLGVKNIAIIVSVLLLIVALIVGIAINSREKHVVLPIKEGSAIVRDSENIYYNSPDGDVMCLPIFETTPYSWLPNFNIMAMNETHFLVTDGNTISIFNKEEKGIDEVYDIKSDNAQFTDDALYYKSPETNKVMKIDRVTKEETTIIPYEVVKFVVYNNQILFAPTTEQGGIISYDLSTGSVMQYAPGVAIAEFTVNEDCIFYSEADNDYQVNKIKLATGAVRVIKDVKAAKLCFGRGIYYYVKPGTKAASKLIINDDDAYI